MPVSAPTLPAASTEPSLDPVDRFEPQQVVPLMDEAIATHRQAIEAICKNNDRSFEGVFLAKEDADRELTRRWSMIEHLNRVVSTPELRTAHATAEKALSAHLLWVNQNRALYDAMAACRWSGTEEEWTLAQRRLRELSLRDFELAGVALEGAARERFKEISLELTQLTSAFANAVLDATDAFHLDVRQKKTLEGIPESDIARFRAAAEGAGIEGFRIGLKGPDVQAVMTYAHSRWLRQRMYRANSTRASDRGMHPEQFDNGDRIERIMELRHEAAQILGFANSAERSLATKMAPSPDSVESFLRGLARSAKPAAEKELRDIEDVANKIGLDEVRPWDLSYVSELLRRMRFAFDAEAVRAYFPADQATAGALEIASRLFGVHFQQRSEVPVWHPDARYFDVLDQGGTIIAGIYVDLFARHGKRGGAWMDVCRDRFAAPGRSQLPVAFLTCNFAGSSGGTSATLRHGDVVTLLHELGHVLHHVLTKVDFPSIGGINKVEWDAVELPSQLMENFAWDYDALKLLSGHVRTGEVLPRPLFERMNAARTFQSGFRLVRQLELALFDLRLHRDYDPARGSRALKMLAKVRREVAVMKVPSWHRLPHAFTHIFAGGYSAGYYSYLWAELLSADAFDRFREAGGLCAETGSCLRDEILARGATRPAAENFAAFRGRDPEPSALLGSYGLAA